MSPPSQCNFKKGPWTPSEDALLLPFVKEHGRLRGAWSTAHSYFEGGLQRCGHCCRLRYLNQLRKGLRCSRHPFTPAAEEVMLAGRTDNDVKNFWNIRTQRPQPQAAFLLAPAGSGAGEPAFRNGSNIISPLQAHLLINSRRRHEAASSPFTRTMAKTVALSSTWSYSAALHQLTTSIPRYHSGDVVVSSSAGEQLPSVHHPFPTPAAKHGRSTATGGLKDHPPEAIAPSEDEIAHGFLIRGTANCLLSSCSPSFDSCCADQLLCPATIPLLHRST